MIATATAPCAECGRQLYAGDVHICGQEPSKPIPIREMLELIAEVHFEMTGEQLDPVKGIWEVHPTGEVWPVVEWYWAAKAWKEAQV